MSLMKSILRTNDDWKEQYDKKESDFKKMFDTDLRKIRENPGSYKCKLRIWVRYVGRVPFYDFQFRSPWRKINTIRKERNEWLELSVRTLGDTPMDKGGKTADQIWTDLRYVLQNYPGKRDLQLTLKSPEIEITAMDVRFSINGVNPETNYDGITRNHIYDELFERFGWEPPKRNIKKRELVDTWLEAVRTEGKSLDTMEVMLNE